MLTDYYLISIEFNNEISQEIQAIDLCNLDQHMIEKGFSITVLNHSKTMGKLPKLHYVKRETNTDVIKILKEVELACIYTKLGSQNIETYKIVVSEITKLATKNLGVADKEDFSIKELCALDYLPYSFYKERTKQELKLSGFDYGFLSPLIRYIDIDHNNEYARDMLPTEEYVKHIEKRYVGDEYGYIGIRPTSYSKTVAIFKIEHQTDKALLINFYLDNNIQKMWIPFSQLNVLKNALPIVQSDRINHTCFLTNLCIMGNKAFYDEIILRSIPDVILRNDIEMYDRTIDALERLPKSNELYAVRISVAKSTLSNHENIKSF